MHILLIEDDKNYGLILKHELEAEAHRVDLASDGVEGVLQFIQDDYEMVLLDIRMPRLTGTDALRIIRSLDPDVPAIAFSANAGEREIQETLAAGANKCLQKPFALSRLKTEMKLEA